MALYDPTLVTAIHPVTGAPIVMPAAVAAQFPGLQIMQQPQAAMGDGSVHNFADGSVRNLGTAPVVPGDAGQPVDEVAPAPMPASGKPKAATPSAVQPGVGVPQAAMDQAAAAVPNAPPPPITKADLDQQGQAGAYNLESNALNKQEAAARQQAQAEAEQSRQLGDAYADELQKADNIDRQRVQFAQAKLNQINQKSAQVDSAIDAVSKMKVDNSIAHPLLGAISLALGGIGAALNHSMENPALNVLNKQIAQNVQVQMANINNARGAVGMQQGQLANMRSQFTDQNALYDAMTAAEIRRAQIMVNQIAQRSNSDIVKAKAQQMIGTMEGQRATAFGNAVTQQVAAEDRQTGLKLEKRGQDISAYEQGQNRAQAASFHKDEMAQMDANRQLDYEKLLASGRQTQAQTLLKQAEDAKISAVNDNNGVPMMSPKGQQLIDSAKNIDAQAEALQAKAQASTDPKEQAQLMAQAQGMAQQAAMQRLQAQGQYTVRARDPKDTILQDIANARQTYAGIQDIRDLVNNGGITNPENRERIQNDFAMISVDMAHKMGARFNDKEFEEFKSAVMGGDPTSVGATTWWREGTGNMDTRFDQMQKSIERGINIQGRARLLNFDNPNSSLIDHGPQPTEADKLSKSIQSSKTPVEEAQGEKPGVIVRGVDRALYPTGPRPWISREQGDLNQKQSVYGLKPDQQSSVDKLIATANNKDPKAQNDAQDAARVLVENATNMSRPALANSVLNALRDNAPALYQQALAKLPQEDQRVRTAPIDMNIAAQLNPRSFAPAPDVADVTKAPVAQLARAAIGGDDASKQELVRRATKLNDKDAALVLTQIARMQQ